MAVGLIDYFRMYNELTSKKKDHLAAATKNLVLDRTKQRILARVEDNTTFGFPCSNSNEINQSICLYEFDPSSKTPAHLEAAQPPLGARTSSDDIPEQLRATRWRPPKECLLKGTGVDKRIIRLVNQLRQLIAAGGDSSVAKKPIDYRFLNSFKNQPHKLFPHIQVDAGKNERHSRLDAGDCAKPITPSSAACCLNRLIVELCTSHAEYIWLVEEVEKASCRSANLKHRFSAEFGPHNASGLSDSSSSTAAAERERIRAHNSNVEKLRQSREQARALERNVETLRQTLESICEDNKSLVPVQNARRNEFLHTQKNLNHTVAVRAERNMKIRDNQNSVQEVTERVNDIELDLIQRRASAAQIISALRANIAMEEQHRFSAMQEVDAVRLVQREKTRQLQSLQTDLDVASIDIGRMKLKITDMDKSFRQLKYKVEPVEKRFEHQSQQLAVVLEEIRILQEQKDTFEFEYQDRIEKITTQQAGLEKQLDEEMLAEHEMLQACQACTGDFDAIDQQLQSLRESAAAKMRDVNMFRESLAVCEDEVNGIVPDLEALKEVKQSHAARAVVLQRELGFKQETFARQLRDVEQSMAALVTKQIGLDKALAEVKKEKDRLMERLLRERGAVKQLFVNRVTAEQEQQELRESANLSAKLERLSSSIQSRLSIVQTAYEKRIRRLTSAVQESLEELEWNESALEVQQNQFIADEDRKASARQAFILRQIKRNVWETVITSKILHLNAVKQKNKSIVIQMSSFETLISDAVALMQAERRALVVHRTALSDEKAAHLQQITDLEEQLQNDMLHTEYVEWQNQRLGWRIECMEATQRIMSEKAARRQRIIGRVRVLALELAGHTMGWRSATEEDRDSEMLMAFARRSMRALRDRAEIYATALHLVQKHLGLYVIRSDLRRAFRAMMHNEGETANSFYEWQCILSKPRVGLSMDGSADARTSDYWMWHCWFCERDRKKAEENKTSK